VTESKFADVPAFRASQDRQTVARVTCDFVASGSGGYYSRACHNLAAWSTGWVGKDGASDTITNDHRCNRHRAIDERTAANRGWGHRDYFPFDGMAEAKVFDAIKATKLEEARLAEVAVKVGQCAAYILAHADLTADQMDALTDITADVAGLVVR
jgi:hypothetical protein